MHSLITFCLIEVHFFGIPHVHTEPNVVSLDMICHVQLSSHCIRMISPLHTNVFPYIIYRILIPEFFMKGKSGNPGKSHEINGKTRVSCRFSEGQRHLRLLHWCLVERTPGRSLMCEQTTPVRLVACPSGATNIRFGIGWHIASVVLDITF